MKYAFIKTYRPVLDDAPYRSFDTMQDYRDWCEQNLPSWLGFGRAEPETADPMPGLTAPPSTSPHTPS
jgi:hypothetical protein